MPEITIGTTEARERLADLLNDVAYGGRRYIVERRGRPLAVLIPPAEYDSLRHLLAGGAASSIHGIPVLVRFDGDAYLISDDQFDLYGQGPTLEAAREDYWLAVQDYLADLAADAGRLAPYLADRLARLRALLAADGQGGAN